MIRPVLPFNESGLGVIRSLLAEGFGFLPVVLAFETTTALAVAVALRLFASLALAFLVVSTELITLTMLVKNAKTSPNTDTVTFS